MVKLLGAFEGSLSRMPAPRRVQVVHFAVWVSAQLRESSAVERWVLNSGKCGVGGVKLRCSGLGLQGFGVSHSNGIPYELKAASLRRLSCVSETCIIGILPAIAKINVTCFLNSDMA